jgi:hypothetical protein
MAIVSPAEIRPAELSMVPLPARVAFRLARMAPEVLSTVPPLARVPVTMATLWPSMP